VGSGRKNAGARRSQVSRAAPGAVPTTNATLDRGSMRAPGPISGRPDDRVPSALWRPARIARALRWSPLAWPGLGPFSDLAWAKEASGACATAIEFVWGLPPVLACPRVACPWAALPPPRKPLQGRKRERSEVVSGLRAAGAGTTSRTMVPAPELGHFTFRSRARGSP